MDVQTTKPLSRDAFDWPRVDGPHTEFPLLEEDPQRHYHHSRWAIVLAGAPPGAGLAN